MDKIEVKKALEIYINPNRNWGKGIYPKARAVIINTIKLVLNNELVEPMSEGELALAINRFLCTRHGIKYDGILARDLAHALSGYVGLASVDIEAVLPAMEESVSENQTWGDTEYNSNAVRYGRNLMREEIKQAFLKARLPKTVVMGDDEIRERLSTREFATWLDEADIERIVSALSGKIPTQLSVKKIEKIVSRHIHEWLIEFCFGGITANLPKEIATAIQKEMSNEI